MVEKSKAERTLTPKQERFCQLYVTYWNATRAAKEAGFSSKSAMQLSYQLLEKPLVQARVKQLSAYALKEIGITRERILTELSHIAFLDPAHAYDEIGQLIPIREMPEEVRRAVGKVRIFEQFNGRGDERELVGFTKEVEFASKKGALDSLLKYLGLLPEKHEHSGPDGKPIQTENKHLALSEEELDTKIQNLLSKTNLHKEEGKNGV